MTDLQLQIELAKLLPEKIKVTPFNNIDWAYKDHDWTIQDTEWLHVCWLIEQGMLFSKRQAYYQCLKEIWSEDCLMGTVTPVDIELVRSSWQQRARAILKVKGVTV